MEPETLQRLVLDDALGVLSDDVRALVAERVAARGGPAVADAAAWRRTVDLARQAMRQGLPDAPAERLPAFPAARMRREAAALRRRRWAGRIAALAACVLVGVGAGFFAFGRAAPSAPAVAPARWVARAGGPAAVPAAVGVREFWSIARLAGAAAESPGPDKFTWFSGGAQPPKGGGS
jgi:hypothetical protein